MIPTETEEVAKKPYQEKSASTAIRPYVAPDLVSGRIDLEDVVQCEACHGAPGFGRFASRRFLRKSISRRNGIECLLSTVAATNRHRSAECRPAAPIPAVRAAGDA